MKRQKPARQRGAVLIIVLWFITLISLLVATLASEVRLSAKAAWFYQQNTQRWALTLQAVHLAQMELMIQRMPVLKKKSSDQEKVKDRYPLLRFNGDPLELAHTLPAGVTVRIYDHAGRLNLRRLSKQRLRDLLRLRIGEDDLERLDGLVQAWQDWTDQDDLKQLNGAEKDYYKKLKPPYLPRNGQLESVAELRFIKGFDEVFSAEELETRFTIYGQANGLNPNYASADALRLLPGMTDEVIAAIMKLREEEEIRSINDFNDLVDGNILLKIKPWLQYNRNGTGVYSIAVQVDMEAWQAAQTEDDKKQTKKSNKTNTKTNTDKPDKKAKKPALKAESSRAFMMTVQNRGYARPPKILRVDPYGLLPGSVAKTPPKTKDKRS
ncbi:type II secretion system protein GspK [Candidatus Venteria ishoeyi]|nr:type II secretion system protein GspK [Candidatus Venteria ishoeyi]MDM8546081.1 type II secretion system protein GspK [Candidatus Venteria ishoeyi]